jgi:EAL domain-containing protein (putative c-di-GMP-specific phosphodiesterase class I)
MYLAKRSGRGVAVYEPALDQSSVRRLTLLGELRRAIDDGQMVLEHQPCFDLRTGHVSGFEALVRWEHPDRGRIPPNDFIHLAEVSRLIEPLSKLVLERAIDEHVAADLGLQVSVNLSARNLTEPGLVAWIADLLDRKGFPGRRLTVEVTESEVMHDVDGGVQTLHELRELGVYVAIDDFGTGHSALAYLKDLPVDELKIDRTFVEGIGASPADAAICGTIVSLAHLLGLRVVAEGVAADGDVMALRQLRCDAAQGFHLGHPVPADGLVASSRLVIGGAAPDVRAVPARR